MSALSHGLLPRPSLSSPSDPSAPTLNNEESTGSSQIDPLSNNDRTPKDHIKAPRPFAYKQEDDDPGIVNNDEHEQSINRRYRPRHSGGFLLESNFSTNTKDEPERPVPTTKGKEKEDTGKVKSWNGLLKKSSHGSRPSIGSSPLARKVLNAGAQESLGNNGTSSFGILEDRHPSSRPFSGGKLDEWMEGAQSNPSVFDTDPAQIVNLALNLSASRRRQFSTGRIPSMDTVDNRWVVTVGRQVQAVSPNSGHGGSLKHHMQQQRRSSRNTSLRLGPNGHYESAALGTRSWQDQTQNTPISTAPAIESQPTLDSEPSPSHATMVRAQRAKSTLELSYEYRRLLQHLSKLPKPQSSRPTTAKGLPKRPLEDSQILGRDYNPLQYIRNRKVRGRERKTLNAEAEGWKDIAKVREWVDGVATENQEQVSRVDDIYSLPEFVPLHENIALNDASPSSSSTKATSIATSKHPRPRSDWITTPWDLLADAYWLSRDENNKLIEDRDGHKLHSSIAKFAGSAAISSRDLPRQLPKRSASVPRASRTVDKPVAPVADSSGFVRDRGRQRHKVNKSIASAHEYNSSHDRMGKWTRKLKRTQSLTSSDESLTGSLQRPTRLHGLHTSRERQDSALLEKQVMDLLAREAMDRHWGSDNGSAESNDFVRYHEGEDKITGASGDVNGDLKLPNASEMQKKLSSELHDPESSLGSAIEHRNQNHGPQRSVDDLDLIAHNSPTEDHSTVSNISINLSPPHSRTKPPRKPLPFPHKSFSHEQKTTDTTDFAITSETSTKQNEEHVEPSTQPSETRHSVFLSPDSAQLLKGLRHRKSDMKPIEATRYSKDPDSRLRGLLKGGSKFAGFVGSPVAKVGDLLWRKEQNHDAPTIQTRGLTYTSDASESDGDTSKRKPSTILSRMAAEGNSGILPETAKYHINNLPIFRSPFKNGDTGESLDHIGQQQVALRGRARPSGFSRLAPPNLDMRSVSPSPSTLLRSRTNDTDDTLDQSRRQSEVPWESGGLPIQRRLAVVDGLPAKIGTGGVPVTGLANYGVNSPQSKDSRGWSITDRETTISPGFISQNDITRTRALLLSTGVRANRISCKAQETRDPPSKILQQLQRDSQTRLPRVPLSQEYILTARLLLKSIDDYNNQLREAADQLSSTTVNSLHDQIKGIDEGAESKLTPLVRASADDADALSVELSTSCRLGIKRLNDSIDSITRRRRQKFRWIRRGGYVLLEWTLLGLMWWVWLIVVIIRLFRGTVRALYTATRWLFGL